MFRYIFSLSSVLASDLVVPTDFDSFSGDVLVSTSFVGIDERDPLTVLTLSRSSLIATGESCCPSERVFLIGDRVRVEDPGIVFSTTTLGRPQIGMGPESAILNSHGPIALVKNLTNPVGLVLNSTEEFFNDFCAPDSMTTIRYFGHAVGIGFPGSLVIGSTTSSPVERVYMKTVSEGMLLGVPFDILSAIVDGLENAGVVRHSGNNFTNCGNLPSSLSITLTIRNSDRSIASLRILPEDYLRPVGGTDVCRLMISTSYRRVILLNPLMLPGVNIRLGRWTREHGGTIQLCDTSL